jgi:hypothetical protein
MGETTAVMWRFNYDDRCGNAMDGHWRSFLAVVVAKGWDLAALTAEQVLGCTEGLQDRGNRTQSIGMFLLHACGTDLRTSSTLKQFARQWATHVASKRNGWVIPNVRPLFRYLMEQLQAVGDDITRLPLAMLVDGFRFVLMAGTGMRLCDVKRIPWMEFPKEPHTVESYAAARWFTMQIFRPKEVRLRQKHKPGGTNWSGPVRVEQNPASTDELVIATSVGRFLDEILRRMRGDSRQLLEPITVDGKKVTAMHLMQRQRTRRDPGHYSEEERQFNIEQQGTEMSSDRIGNSIKRLVKLAKGDEFQVRHLRHMFATVVMRSNVWTLKQTQDQLRHRSGATTEDAYISSNVQEAVKTRWEAAGTAENRAQLSVAEIIRL